MRIVYAIILAVSLIGCDDAKKKEGGDNAVGGGPGGAGADEGGMSAGGNTRRGKSGRGQTGGGNGRSNGLSPDEAAIDQKIAQLEKQKVELNGKIDAAQRRLEEARRGSADAPSAELTRAGTALIREVLAAGETGIPRRPIPLTADQVEPLRAAVNAVPQRTVARSPQRTAALTSALEGLRAIVTRMPTPGSGTALRQLIAAVEGEMAETGDFFTAFDNALLESIAGVTGEPAVPEAITAAAQTFIATRNSDNRQALINSISGARDAASASFNDGGPFHAIIVARDALDDAVFSFNQRPYAVEVRKQNCLWIFGQLAGGGIDPLDDAINGYYFASGDDSRARARTVLLDEIERLDETRRTPVATEYETYMRLKVSQAERDAQSELSGLNAQSEAIDSQIAAEMVKKKK